MSMSNAWKCSSNFSIFFVFFAVMLSKKWKKNWGRQQNVSCFFPLVFLLLDFISPWEQETKKRRKKLNAKALTLKVWWHLFDGSLGLTVFLPQLPKELSISDKGNCVSYFWFLIVGFCCLNGFFSCETCRFYWEEAETSCSSTGKSTNDSTEELHQIPSRCWSFLFSVE